MKIEIKRDFFLFVAQMFCVTINSREITGYRFGYHQTVQDYIDIVWCLKQY